MTNPDKAYNGRAILTDAHRTRTNREPGLTAMFAALEQIVIHPNVTNPTVY